MIVTIVNTHLSLLYFLRVRTDAKRSIDWVLSMNSAIEIEKSTATAPSVMSSSASTETASAVELFSYLLCCALQGAVGIIGFALLTIVPIAIRQGLLPHWLG